MCQAGGDPNLAEQMLAQLQLRYDAFTRDPSAAACITFLVALVTATRSSDPLVALRSDYGIHLSGPGNEQIFLALHNICPEDHPFKKAALRTLDWIACKDSDSDLFKTDLWGTWREFDGSAFCDLARTFFSELNLVCFAETLLVNKLAVNDDVVRRFAWEMALITRSFSVRWFKACATDRTPEDGSIRWYLGHCLGKLDLELSRESKHWIEPTGNPWRRKKPAPSPALTF